MSCGASGASSAKTVRFRGSTGSARPASAATACEGRQRQPACRRRPHAVGEPDSGDAARYCFNRSDIAVTSLAPASPRRYGRAKQRVRVGPSFTGETERSRRDPFEREPGKRVSKRVALEQHDRRALGLLDAIAIFEDRAPVGRSQNEVAAFAKCRVNLRTETRAACCADRARSATAGCSPASRTASGWRRRKVWSPRTRKLDRARSRRLCLENARQPPGRWRWPNRSPHRLRWRCLKGDSLILCRWHDDGLSARPKRTGSRIQQDEENSGPSPTAANRRSSARRSQAPDHSRGFRSRDWAHKAR